jgi:hypothetical protein
MGTCRVPHKEEVFSISAMSLGIFSDPRRGESDVFRKSGKPDFGVKPVIGSDEEDSFLGKLFADFTMIILLTPTPTSSVKEKNDWCRLTGFRTDYVENLTIVLSIGKV